MRKHHKVPRIATKSQLSAGSRLATLQKFIPLAQRESHPQSCDHAVASKIAIAAVEC